MLRGVGVLGMLAVHIQLFAFPSLARWNPTAYGDFTGLNWWVWLATSVLADGKFIAIFAMLLGVSIVMLAERRWRAGPSRPGVSTCVGWRRCWSWASCTPTCSGTATCSFALALCGAVVFFARRLSPRWLLVLGGLAFAAGSVAVARADMVHRPSPTRPRWPRGRTQWTPRPVIIDLEIAQYRGGWAEQMAPAGAGGAGDRDRSTSSPGSSGR